MHIADINFVTFLAQIFIAVHWRHDIKGEFCHLKEHGPFATSHSKFLYESPTSSFAFMFFLFFFLHPFYVAIFFAKIHLKDLEDVVSSSTGSEVEIWPQKAHFNYFRVSKSILRQHFTSYMCSANNCVLQICL